MPLPAPRLLGLGLLGLSGLTLLHGLPQAQTVRVPTEHSGQPAAGWPSAESGRFLDSAPAPVPTPEAPAAAASQAAAPREDGPWPPPVIEPARADGCSTALTGSGRTFHVGPGQTFTELDEVPWLSLQAGDVVNIHHRPEPYRTKIGLRAQGRADAPVALNGVTDAQCRRPVISGENATTARDAAASGFFSKQYSEPYGLIFIYKSRDQAWGSRPRHIRIQNLKLTGAHKDRRYTGMDGQSGRYVAGAAAIYAIVVEDLTVENCEITGNGNGIFVNSRSDEESSRNVFIRHNRIWNNGNVGSWLEHNLYVQTARALYEGNDIGQLIPGARGSSLKDRSSGTVVRFNRITAAARALDLVEIEGGVRPVREDRHYPDAWVYGNLILNDLSLPGSGSVKLIHWGGDNDERHFRNGTLHFFHNTVIHSGTQQQAWYMALFDMPGARQTVRATGNLIVNLGSTQMRIGHQAGTVEFAGSNWISRDWAQAGPDSVVRVRTSGAQLFEGPPPAISTASGRMRTPLARLDQPAGDLPTDSAGQPLRLSHQIGEERGLARRPVRGRGPDLGAIEQP